MNVGGDTNALFLPGPDEMTKQGLAIPAFRHQYFHASPQDELSSLCLREVSDADYHCRDAA